MIDKKYLIGRFVNYLCIFFPYKSNNLIIVPLERNNIKVHVARPQEYSWKILGLGSHSGILYLPRSPRNYIVISLDVPPKRISPRRWALSKSIRNHLSPWIFFYHRSSRYVLQLCSRLSLNLKYWGEAKLSPRHNILSSFFPFTRVIDLFLNK